jgi:hypothetical protein
MYVYIYVYRLHARLNEVTERERDASLKCREAELKLKDRDRLSLPTRDPSLLASLHTLAAPAGDVFARSLNSFAVSSTTLNATLATATAESRERVGVGKQSDEPSQRSDGFPDAGLAASLRQLENAHHVEVSRRLLHGKEAELQTARTELRSIAFAQ